MSSPPDVHASRRPVTARPTRRRPWLLEPEVLLLVLLVAGVYFTRIGSLTIRGEETRRATIATEMIASGDWIVPRQQGEPFLSRPPLQNWTIALLGLARGEVDVLAVRLPSVLAVLLMTLLVYWYARIFLDRLGAFAAAAALATFGQILELGRLGETDAMLALCVSGSLLLWHGGWMRGRPPVWCWVAGYSMAALGVLVKGPQAPVYFGGPVVVYLLLGRQWRHLFRWPHFVGIGVFAVVVGAWLVPFWAQMGLEGVMSMGSREVGIRFWDISFGKFLGHLVSYPAEILLGGLLPWSALLIAYLDPKFRRGLGAARTPALFAITVIGVTFPTCWLVPGAETRLFVSILPMVAPLIGVVVQRSHESIPPGLWEKLWRPFAVIIAAIAGGGALVILGTSGLDTTRSPLIMTPAFAVVCIVAAALAAAVIGWAMRAKTEARGRWAVLAVAAIAGFFYTGPVVTARINNSENPAAAVAALKAQLPEDAELVSFGRIHHLFSYHYAEPIELHDWPDDPDEVPPEVEYFCFDVDPDRGEPPIAWEEVMVISCDRSRHEEPQTRVIVGRRLPEPGRPVLGRDGVP